MLARCTHPVRLLYRQLSSMSVRDQPLSDFRRVGTKIVCVGRNYKDHALELGNAIPDKPMIFVKTTNSYLGEGESIVIPEGCSNLHQEVELGVVIGRLAKNVRREQALDYVAGYTVALDMTARDFQDEAKAKGAPWFFAKSFDGSCPVGEFIERSQIKDPHDEELFCRINGVEKQRCKTNVMMFPIPVLIEFITRWVTLYPGDLLLTGTPKGVSKVTHGDSIEIGLQGRTTTTFSVK